MEASAVGLGADQHKGIMMSKGSSSGRVLCKPTSSSAASARRVPSADAASAVASQLTDEEAVRAVVNMPYHGPSFISLKRAASYLQARVDSTANEKDEAKREVEMLRERERDRKSVV